MLIDRMLRNSKDFGHLPTVFSGCDELQALKLATGEVGIDINPLNNYTIFDIANFRICTFFLKEMSHFYYLACNQSCKIGRHSLDSIKHNFAQLLGDLPRARSAMFGIEAARRQL